jgi:hypothetical protein
MANEILVKVKSGQIVFADHGTDYVGGSGNNALQIAGSTEVQIDLTGLAAGAARQSTKVDLGDPRPEIYSVMISIEMATDPLAGETLDLFWSPSPQSGAAVANAGGCSGSDSAYTGYAASTLQEGLDELIPIGPLRLAVMNDADGVPQLGYVGLFSPPERYGSLVVRNGSATDNLHSDAVEMAISFNPSITPEIQ